MRVPYNPLVYNNCQMVNLIMYEQLCCNISFGTISVVDILKEKKLIYKGILM